eukprot:TRINITY_DN2493_c0_g1_i1.p1 TRINITY_DN2493_c0_g1~~TRINITY_DN2493_c0_g1_i1.p1  ORF type:complete len:495 (+),score=106.69 TRINITY_DN2493_c0_g1_i1:63-1547(+)
MMRHGIIFLSGVVGASAGTCGTKADALGTTCGQNMSLWCSHDACKSDANEFMATCAHLNSMKVPVDMIRENMPCVPTGCAASQTMLGNTCGESSDDWCSKEACKDVATSFLSMCGGDAMMEVPVKMIEIKMPCVENVCKSKRATLETTCGQDASKWCGNDECQAVARDFLDSCEDEVMMSVPVRVVKEGMPCINEPGTDELSGDVASSAPQVADECKTKQESLTVTCGEDPNTWCENDGCKRVAADFVASCADDTAMTVPLNVIKSKMPCLETSCIDKQDLLKVACGENMDTWCSTPACKEAATAFLDSCEADKMMSVPVGVIKTYMDCLGGEVPSVGAVQYGAAAPGATSTEAPSSSWHWYHYLLIILGVCCICPCIALACSAFLCYESIEWIFGGDEKPQKKKKSRAIKVPASAPAPALPAEQAPLMQAKPVVTSVVQLPTYTTHAVAPAVTYAQSVPHVTYAAPQVTYVNQPVSHVVAAPHLQSGFVVPPQ